LRILEILSGHPQGMLFYEVADAIKIPRSATHRLLASLVEEGYVRQERDFGSYVLTAKIASLGFRYLSGHGITDLMQPVLDRLAQDCGELVRVAILDNDQLTFVAKAQGRPYRPALRPRGPVRRPSSPARPPASPGSRP
jgi:IclR family acetate operon transcriptional repressor